MDEVCGIGVWTSEAHAYLCQLHERDGADGVHEMHPDDAVRFVRDGCETRDGDGAGVGGEDGLEGRDLRGEGMKCHSACIGISITGLP